MSTLNTVMGSMSIGLAVILLAGGAVINGIFFIVIGVFIFSVQEKV